MEGQGLVAVIDMLGNTIMQLRVQLQQLQRANEELARELEEKARE